MEVDFGLNTSSFDIFDKAIKQVIKKYSGREFYNDLYQECYMKILEMLKNNPYEPIHNLYGYAYRISRNQVTYYLYHNKKLVTVKEEDYSMFEAITDVGEMRPDTSVIMDELATNIIKRFNNVLPEDFDVDALMNIVYTDDRNIDDLKYRVIKGAFLWDVEDSLKR